MVSPLNTKPQSVAIVGLGPSNRDYVTAAAQKKGAPIIDEVWVVNSAIDVIRADKAFIMDDLKRLAHRYPEWAAKLKHTQVPIITSTAYELYPTSIAYPLDEVFKTIQDDTFTTTVAYMIAYAIHIQVEEMLLYGCDFWYPNSQAVESGLGAVSYLLGIAKQKGIHFKIPQSSTLLDAHMVYVEDGKVKRPLYGYDYNPGESEKRVAKGNATELDKLAAQKAPYTTKAVKPSKHDGGSKDGIQSENA